MRIDWDRRFAPTVWTARYKNYIIQLTDSDKDEFYVKGEVYPTSDFRRRILQTYSNGTFDEAATSLVNTLKELEAEKDWENLMLATGSNKLE